MVVTEQSLCVSDLIRHESITTLFQPLVSIKKKSIIGIEALSRGIDPYDGRMIPPNVLFNQATREDILLDLDRLCRDKACENFAALCQHIAEKPILFLNIDTSIIDTGVVGSQYLLKQIKQSGLDPSTIAIEIIESKVHDHQALQRFVETYRDYGFIIALDDVGAGHSNLDRISLVKPDVIKIDRSLITDINREYYKQIVVKSLVSLAQNIGALVVAEGIENENEAVTTLELGADLLQGFYFSRPQEANWERLNNAAENIAHVATDYRSSMISHVRELKARYQAYDDMIADLVCELSCAAPRDYDVTLQVLADRYHILECIYILDNHGIQISNTVSHIDHASWQRKQFFRPADKGTDHSLKEYYYLLVNTSIDKYTTAPYISLATGNQCVTLSVIFYDADGNERVLCVDVNPA